jgi:hypothetical protein
MTTKMQPRVPPGAQAKARTSYARSQAIEFTCCCKAASAQRATCDGREAEKALAIPRGADTGSMRGCAQHQ